MQITPRIKAYLMLLAVSVIWGVASPVIKYTLTGFAPATFLAYRFGISTIIAIIIAALTGIHIPKNGKVFLLFLLYGFLNSVVALGLLFFGMENTTVLETGLITLAGPLIISTAGVYFLHEHVTKREKLGMGIAMFGTLLTILQPLISNGHSALKLSGNILVLGYVLATVVTAVLSKELLKKDVNPMSLTNASFIIGFLFFLPVVLRNPNFNLNTEVFNVPLSYHFGVWYMAILSGTLAFYLSNRAQKTIEIGEQSLFAYLYPVFSLPLAVIWLGEKVTTTHIVGGAIIIIGVVIAEIKKKRYNTTSRN